MISTRDLSQLPNINRLKMLTQSLAILDAILSPEWEYRYYSFNVNWDVDEAVASMRNGSGDELFAVFNPAGAVIKGFAHESLMSPFVNNPPTIWPGVIDSVPEEFEEYLSEPAFSPLNTTFCIWRTYSDSIWQRGNIAFPEGTDPDGSLELLARFDGNPRTYKKWAEGYYECPVSLSAIIHIYEHRPLIDGIITELNSEVSMIELEEDIRKIAYPQERAR